MSLRLTNKGVVEAQKEVKDIVPKSHEVKAIKSEGVVIENNGHHHHHYRWQKIAIIIGVIFVVGFLLLSGIALWYTSVVSSGKLSDNSTVINHVDSPDINPTFNNPETNNFDNSFDNKFEIKNNITIELGDDIARILAERVLEIVDDELSNSTE